LPDALTGRDVCLRPLVSADAADYANAFAQDPEIGRLLGIEQDPNEQTVLDTVASQGQFAADGEGVELAIADPVTGQLWGSLRVHQLRWHHRRGEIGFWLIPSQRGRGVGGSVASLTLSWLFNELDLLRVEMNTIPENSAMVALARRLGFVQEGIQRSRNLERGSRVDIVLFGLLRDEWTRTV
jgi:[ribosomal protein S5]-alanine N-acetyltransferase